MLALAAALGCAFAPAGVATVRVLRTPSILCVEEGDLVRVIADVTVKGGLNAKGLIGTVTSKWEASEDEWGACCELAWGEPTLTVALTRDGKARSNGPVGYFEYDELMMVEKAGERTAENRFEQFVEGDRVRVTADVSVRGRSAKGRLGTVISAWSQCETDPACCCNELATVPLQVRLDDQDDAAILPESHESGAVAPLIGYFNEDEVITV